MTTPMPHTPAQYFVEPLPHLHIEQLLSPETHHQLVFPELPQTPNGRSGNDIYRCDAQWPIEIAKPGWRELGAIMLGEAFVKHVVGLFAEDMRRQGCLIDPNKTYLIDYIEGWDKDGKTASPPAPDDPHSLFVRFDFQGGRDTYRKRVHCDLDRRVCGGMLFMADADEEGMVGGEFGLFRDLEFANDRVCHKPD